MFEIGSSLREARERRGLSSQDVQKAIRIRDRYLNALEEERWELLPGEAYVKGFLRTYADYLGLDGNLYVDEYNSRFARPPDDQLLVPQQFARRGPARSGGMWRPLLALVVVVAVVAGVAVWQLRGNAGSQQAGQTGHTTIKRPATHPKKHHHKTRPRHGKQPVSLPTRAVLAATRGTCWLEVRSGSATGALLFEGTLQQGQTQTVSLVRGPLWIDVGDPPNLDVRMGGRIVPGLPSQTGTVLLTNRGLKPG